MFGQLWSYTAFAKVLHILCVLHRESTNSLIIVSLGNSQLNMCRVCKFLYLIQFPHIAVAHRMPCIYQWFIYLYDITVGHTWVFEILKFFQFTIVCLRSYWVPVFFKYLVAFQPLPLMIIAVFSFITCSPHCKYLVMYTYFTHAVAAETSREILSQVWSRGKAVPAS